MSNLRKLEIIEKIKGMPLLDAAFNFSKTPNYLGYNKLEALQEIFPDYSTDHIKESFDAVKKLNFNAITYLQEFDYFSAILSKKFIKKIKRSCPEFSELLVFRYFHWASLKHFMGHSADQDLTDQDLVTMGLYNAVALLDERANFRRENKLSWNKYLYPELIFDLFPNLLESDEELYKAMDKVNSLAELCLNLRKEYSIQNEGAYQSQKKLLKLNNPGFSDECYKAAWDDALHCLR